MSVQPDYYSDAVMIITDLSDPVAIPATAGPWKVLHIRGLTEEQVGPLHTSLAAAQAYAAHVFSDIVGWTQAGPRACIARVAATSGPPDAARTSGDVDPVQG